MDAKEQTMDAKEQAMDARQQALGARQQAMDARQQALDARQQELDARHHHRDNKFAKASERAKSVTVRAQFILQEKKAFDLEDGMRLFYLFDITKSNDLSLEEIITGSTQIQEVVALLEKHTQSAMGLFLDDSRVAACFKRVDTDNSGRLDVAEWKSFLAELVDDDVHYAYTKGLAYGSCYWATSPPTQPEPSYHFLSTDEWWSDFWFFTKNNNSLLGIFLAHPDNRLKTMQRLNIEFTCVSWTLLWSATVARTQTSVTRA